MQLQLLQHAMSWGAAHFPQMDPVIETKETSQECTQKALLSSYATSPFATTTDSDIDKN